MGAEPLAGSLGAALFAEGGLFAPLLPVLFNVLVPTKKDRCTSLNH
jgi:hypothetical protein